jgi:transcriptional regulator with XRE-family HTH domain
VSSFDLPGVLRRIRRSADLSQRQLADRLQIAKSSVGRAESGLAGLDVRMLARAAVLAGLRLALLDAEGDEVRPMAADGARDRGNRRLPAHLDTRYGDEGWWYDVHRYGRERPWFTFDRDRAARDADRHRDGTPDDHHVPLPGDSPGERAEARRRAYWRRVADERQRRLAAGEFRQLGDWFTCTCPARCEELDDFSGRPVHADECRCRCDIG